MLHHCECINRAACHSGHHCPGDRCQLQPADPCAAAPCHSGHCRPLEHGGHTCSCAPGYTGATCDTRVRDLCEPSPCHAGVACTSRDWYFTCGPCPPGTLGDGITCLAAGAGCPGNEVTCEHVSPRPLEPDCSGGDCFTDHCLSSPCHPGVDCVSLGPDYTCGACPPGTQGDGRTCVDLDPCLSGPCYAGVTCQPAQDGGYTCGACPANMTGDGETCRPDHCARHNPCHPGVTCHNTRTRAKCGACPPGYEGNGAKCTAARDPCASSPCWPGVACVNVRMGGSTGHVCGLCPPGLVGDGARCEEPDSCPDTHRWAGFSISRNVRPLSNKHLMIIWSRLFYKWNRWDR